jgi:hypothetical protein
MPLPYSGLKMKTLKIPARIRWQAALYVPPKRLLTFNRLHGVVSQKMRVFIKVEVGTSNHTILSEVQCPEFFAKIRDQFKHVSAFHLKLGTMAKDCSMTAAQGSTLSKQTVLSWLLGQALELCCCGY